MSNDNGPTYWCNQYHQLDAQSKAKILELEQRVKVLTDALEEIASYDGNSAAMLHVIAQQALNQTPQQTSAQIERRHIEWMMKLPVVGYFQIQKIGNSEWPIFGIVDELGWSELYAIPKLP